MSSWVGDFRTGKTIRKMFNSNAVAGESITLATNGTVSVYKDGGTTQSTTGVTFTEDFDSLTGVHLVAVDTSADGTFYSAGSDFEVVLSGATIDGKSINATLFSFSLQNRSALMPTTDGRLLDVSAGGEAGVDWANVGSPTTTLNLSGTTIGVVTDLADGSINAASLASDTITAAKIASDTITAAKIAADAITAAKIADGAIDAGALADNCITAAKIATNAIDSDAIATSAADLIADEVWDELVAGHTAFGTYGQRLQPVWETVATAATANTVTLNTGTQPDDFFNGQMIFITGGTGVGQVRRIVDWVSSTKVITVSPNWTTNPAASSDIVILPDRAESDGSGLTAGAVADSVWDEARADHTTAGTFGQGAASVQGNVTGSIGSVATDGISASSIAADAIGASELAATAATEIASAVWDRARSSHVADGSFGQSLQLIRAGTAQGGAGSSITLDSGASATDDFYLNGLLQIIGGTGVGQARYITDYVGSSKVATVSSAWGTAPDNTSVFVIHPGDAVPGASAPSAATVAAAVWDEARSSHTTSGTFGQGVASVQGNVTGSAASVTGNVGGNVAGSVGSVTGNVGGNVTGSVGSVATNGITATSLDATAGAEIADAVWDEPRTDHVAAGSFGQSLQLIRSGTAQAGASTTITLDASASAINDFYNNTLIEIIGGTGAGQARFISDYVGTSKVATVSEVWSTTPDSSSVFAIESFGAIPGATAPTAAQVADAVWDETRADHTTAGTFGQGAASVQGNVTGTVASVTGNVAGNVTGSVGSLAAQAKADVNAEVVDVLNVDTFAELTGVPAASATFTQMVRWLFLLARNTLTQTATTATIKADNGSTNVATASTSDDGTTFQRSEWS